MQALCISLSLTRQRRVGAVVVDVVRPVLEALQKGGSGGTDTEADYSVK